MCGRAWAARFSTLVREDIAVVRKRQPRPAGAYLRFEMLWVGGPLCVCAREPGGRLPIAMQRRHEHEQVGFRADGMASGLLGEQSGSFRAGRTGAARAGGVERSRSAVSGRILCSPGCSSRKRRSMSLREIPVEWSAASSAHPSPVPTEAGLKSSPANAAGARHSKPGCTIPAIVREIDDSTAAEVAAH